MHSKMYDLLVIGAGPAGMRAALDAVQAGVKTALVEAAFLGGTCLNSGCIPTKFLLGATCSLSLGTAQKQCAVASGDLHINFAALQDRKNAYLKEERRRLQESLHVAGVSFFAGKASFMDEHTVHVQGVEEHTLAFQSAVVAVGTVPVFFPTMRPDGAHVHTSAGILNLKRVPESLIVVGGGAIGLELSELFHRLGSQIVLVEGSPRLLPGEDPETGETIARYAQQQGWQVHLGKKIASLVSDAAGALLTFESGECIHAADALLAIGRRPALAALKPEAANLAVKPTGALDTDSCLRCGKNVYAIGDINARAPISHAAIDQGKYVVRHLTGKTEAPYAPSAMPSCIYGTMEIMRVGPTEAELRKLNKDVAVSTIPMSRSPMAHAYGHTDGFVKLVWVDNVLQSVTAVGHHASHLVSIAALLIRDGIGRNESLNIIFAHPTLDELVELGISNGFAD